MPIYGKSVHTTTVVLYMNTVSYLVADAKKPRKQRKLNVANEKENSDASKPQDKLQIESKSPISDSSKTNIKAKRFALQLQQKNCINKTPTEVIDADAHIPKDVKPLQPWVVGLSQDDRSRVTGGEWLNDKLITAFQKLLKQQFPHLSGLQDVSLGQTLSFEIEAAEFVQVLHTGCGHWVTVSTIACAPGEVDIFDSLPPAPTCDLKGQIAALLATPLKFITLR